MTHGRNESVDMDLNQHWKKNLKAMKKKQKSYNHGNNHSGGYSGRRGRGGGRYNQRGRGRGGSARYNGRSRSDNGDYNNTNDHHIVQASTTTDDGRLNVYALAKYLRHAELKAHEERLDKLEQEAQESGDQAESLQNSRNTKVVSSDRNTRPHRQRWDKGTKEEQQRRRKVWLMHRLNTSLAITVTICLLSFVMYSYSRLISSNKSSYQWPGFSLFKQGAAAAAKYARKMKRQSY
ncbi:hypothetical protein MP228_000444 [Amoeboaphelidium protococcarum]|nr:hypothetical protein MP228_000444 [Amoeboaphelidium protococcarum]